MHKFSRPLVHRRSSPARPFFSGCAVIALAENRRVGRRHAPCRARRGHALQCGEGPARQASRYAGRRPVRRGRAPASLFALGPPRAADERVQLLCRRATTTSRSRSAQRFLVDPSGQQGRALRLLPDRVCAITSRSATSTATRRSPSQALDALSELNRRYPRTRICRRRAAQDRPGPRSPRRQGNGDRPLLRDDAASGSPRRLRFRSVVEEYQTTTPRARSADAPDRNQSRAGRAGRSAQALRRCSAPTIRAASGTSTPMS